MVPISFVVGLDYNPGRVNGPKKEQCFYVVTEQARVFPSCIDDVSNVVCNYTSAGDVDKFCQALNLQ